MDWVVDRQDAASVEQLLRDLRRHLRQHAAVESGVDEALTQVERTVAASVADGPMRVHLDWRGGRPRLLLGEPDDHPEPLVLDLEHRTPRTFPDGPPPTPPVDLDLDQDGAATLGLAMVAVRDAHPTADPNQTAALAGALVADHLVAQEGAASADPEAVARLVARAHRALGSDATAAAQADGSVELTIGRCPLGRGVVGHPSVCHASTGAAGRVAARAAGEAVVVMQRSIALGDDGCRLTVLLRPVDAGTRGERHVWPPVASAADAAPPHLELSVLLPIESASVPVVRRLAGQALRTFGVLADDIDDVQLAITEACANVVDHAHEADRYEVRFELAAERCAITVVDQGGGFDASAVPSDVEVTAEDGRGLSLMRALVDRLDFRSEPRAGAVVHMVKALRYSVDHPLRQAAQG